MKKKIRKKNKKAIDLIEKWKKEGNIFDNDDEFVDFLKTLDKDRESDRLLFPWLDK